jgi:integrase
VHRLPLLWLDWSGARVASVDATLVGDYDEPRRRVRLRRSTTKSRRSLWVDLPDVLAEAIEATLPPRENREPEARLFAGSGSDALRTSIAKACKALAIPLWSPHDLRHRRISLLLPAADPALTEMLRVTRQVDEPLSSTSTGTP